MALPLFSIMLRPEWPPRKPRTVRRTGTEPSRGAASAERQLGVAVGATGASDVDRAILLGVEVDHGAAADERGVELHRAGEAGLLVDRTQDLERAVYGVRVISHGQGGRKADAVVRPEGRSSSRRPSRRRPRG